MSARAALYVAAVLGLCAGASAIKHHLADLMEHEDYVTVAANHQLTAFERVHAENHPHSRQVLMGLRTLGTSTDDLYRRFIHDLVANPQDYVDGGRAYFPNDPYLHDFEHFGWKVDHVPNDPHTILLSIAETEEEQVPDEDAGEDHESSFLEEGESDSLLSLQGTLNLRHASSAARRRRLVNSRKAHAKKGFIGKKKDKAKVIPGAPPGAPGIKGSPKLPKVCKDKTKGQEPAPTNPARTACQQAMAMEITKFAEKQATDASKDKVKQFLKITGDADKQISKVLKELTTANTTLNGVIAQFDVVATSRLSKFGSFLKKVAVGVVKAMSDVLKWGVGFVYGLFKTVVEVLKSAFDWTVLKTKVIMGSNQDGGADQQCGCPEGEGTPEQCPDTYCELPGACRDGMAFTAMLDTLGAKDAKGRAEHGSALLQMACDAANVKEYHACTKGGKPSAECLSASKKSGKQSLDKPCLCPRLLYNYTATGEGGKRSVAGLITHGLNDPDHIVGGLEYWKTQTEGGVAGKGCIDDVPVPWQVEFDFLTKQKNELQTAYDLAYGETQKDGRGDMKNPLVVGYSEAISEVDEKLNAAGQSNGGCGGKKSFTGGLIKGIDRIRKGLGAFVPDIGIYGASAGISGSVAGVENVFDFVTYEQSLFTFGGVTMGTLGGGCAGIYIGFGFKGTTKGDPLEESYKGWFAGMEFTPVFPLTLIIPPIFGVGFYSTGTPASVPVPDGTGGKISDGEAESAVGKVLDKLTGGIVPDLMAVRTMGVGICVSMDAFWPGNPLPVSFLTTFYVYLGGMCTAPGKHEFSAYAKALVGFDSATKKSFEGLPIFGPLARAAYAVVHLPMLVLAFVKTILSGKRLHKYKRCSPHASEDSWVNALKFSSGHQAPKEPGWSAEMVQADTALAKLAKLIDQIKDTAVGSTVNKRTRAKQPLSGGLMGSARNVHAGLEKKMGAIRETYWRNFRLIHDAAMKSMEKDCEKDKNCQNPITSPMADHKPPSPTYAFLEDCTCCKAFRVGGEILFKAPGGGVPTESVADGGECTDDLLCKSRCCGHDGAEVGDGAPKAGKCHAEAALDAGGACTASCMCKSEFCSKDGKCEDPKPATGTAPAGKTEGKVAILTAEEGEKTEITAPDRGAVPIAKEEDPTWGASLKTQCIDCADKCGKGECTLKQNSELCKATMQAKEPPTKDNPDTKPNLDKAEGAPPPEGAPPAPAPPEGAPAAPAPPAGAPPAPAPPAL